MSEKKYIKMTRDKGAAFLLMDRPKHNVLDIEMIREFTAALKEAAADPDLKCLVIRGKGAGFCAGVEVSDHKPEMVHEMISSFNTIFEAMETLEIPVIAAVEGACLGGGMEVAIACDIIVAAKGAVFGQPEIKLGFLPPFAAIRLPELVGPARAIEICASGRRYSAKEGRRMGFVSHVFSDDKFEKKLGKLIKEFTYSSPLILRLNKRAVKAHLGLPFKDALAGVSDLFLNTLMKTEDTLEGIKSFEEKRPAEWKNR
ncbi:Enoyl-CoA hydratase [Candidatus Desulfarcum epimagneticum]|uniref:Enoyl-CoA hydratase n=1 Tax=uncultured Desulfobacteraceae bacterium TaxID=218296 RepID=A0A484HN87_9BACT|nr:Enoyl-CoA hydratase [uncultured Desulfobacteraceae bacterium]